MSLAEEISQLNAKFGTEVSPNLYTSVYLCLLGWRHLIITTEDFERTRDELVVILDVYWEIGVVFVNITEETTIDELILALADGAVFVLVGLDSLVKEVQLEFLDLIQRSIKDKCLIGVVRDTNKLSRFLKDEFWFQQAHNFEDAGFQVPTEHKSKSKTNIKSNTNKLDEFALLRPKISEVAVVPELKRYAYDIVIFARTHRAVDSGMATRHYEGLLLLGRTLCVVFGREYLVPTVLKLAARKLVPLHVEIIAAAHEPSLLWGSDPVLAAELVRRSSGLTVTEDVLNKVCVPL